ncbi:MAG TPA: hypothetical protein VMV73_01800 [Candidatus Dormibacteraeota bacterium]|nr:hypothetical protein [Candidatus Dormibacteraeota bacterium]
MNAPTQTTLLRAIALAAMLAGAAIGAAHGASNTTVGGSAAVAAGQHVVFDCSKAQVSCAITAIGEKSSNAVVNADISGPDAADVQIIQTPGEPHFTVFINGTGSQPNSFGSWLASIFHVSSWFRSNATALVTLRVPERNPLDISDTNGNVSVRGVHARIHISTVNSDVRSSDSSEFDISTVNGSVHARIPAGTPKVHASTVNGAITLLVPSGFNTKVKTSTVNGHTHNPFDGANGAGSVNLSTVNGSITVTRS